VDEHNWGGLDYMGEALIIIDDTGHDLTKFRVRIDLTRNYHSVLLGFEMYQINVYLYKDFTLVIYLQ
jgi:hypothetical protein